MITDLLARFPGRRVLVLGDLMLDEFIWGKVSRISPEAPVPVVNVTGESYYPGGAANVARNVREFTTETAVMGLAGADAAGNRLLELLRSSGIDTSGVQQDPACSTTLKTRIIARNQQVVRVDRERKAPLTAEQEMRALAHLERTIDGVDAVIAADYGKGFLTQPLADHICRLAREHGKILTVDPHPNTSLSWHGATVIKPNRAEAFAAAGLPPSEDQPLPDVARRLFERWECRNLLITLGEDGMMLFPHDGPPQHIPARVQDVFDVSGAGDTAIAVLTVALAAGHSPLVAAGLACLASGIVVGKLGTATVSAAELRASLP